MIDRPNNVIFVKVPKTAGTSILATFLEPLHFSNLEWDNDVIVNLNHVVGFRISDQFRMPGRTKRYNGWHVSARDLKRFLGDDFAGFRRFTSVRHPYDRLVSNYEFQRSKGRPVKGFDRFVETLAERPHELHRQVQLHAIPQFAWLSDDDGTLLVERVLRWESLDEELRRLRTDWRLSPSELPRRNVSDRRRSLASYYASAATCEIVDALYQVDFHRLGYTPDMIQPG